MTRRGTLAYYLAAWVIGSLTSSLLLWIEQARYGTEVGAAWVLESFGRMLFLAAVDMLVFAFLLRSLMRWRRIQQMWIWLPTGAALGTVLRLIPIHIINYGFAGPLGFLLVIVLAGPAVLHDREVFALWHSTVEGAATAATLCLVERAFKGPAEKSAADPRPT